MIRQPSVDRGPRRLTILPDQLHVNRAIPIGALALLFAGGAPDLAGQGGVIRGHVVHAETAVALADAEVVLSPSGASTWTDAQGYFEFRGAPLGEAELVVQRPGFVSAAVPVRLDANAATEVEIALEPVAAVLEVIVAAIRASHGRGEVFGATSVADSSAILRDRTVGLHEALRMMPGVQVSSRTGTHDVNIGIRGSAAQTVQAVRGVTVLLDGVPLTQPEGRTRVDIIELAAARQVEVVRGPASALHAGTGGGVVNIVSRTGRDSPGAAARVQAGAFGFRKYDARGGGLFANGRGSAFAAASHTAADGYRSHSDAEVLRGQLVLDYLAGSHTRLTVQAIGSRLDSRLPGPLSLSQLDADPDAAAPAAIAFGFGRQDRSYRAGARLERTIGEAVAGGYAFYGRGTLFLPIPGLIVDNDLGRAQGGGFLRTGRLGPLPVSGTVGFDFDRLYGSDIHWENDAGVPGEKMAETRLSIPALGAYGQVEWSASSTVAATLGLRYDRVAYDFSDVLVDGAPRRERALAQASPRFAVEWRPDAATWAYGSVGRGFEVPTAAEIGPFLREPARPLRPKSLWNYEVGGRRALGDRLHVEASAFLATVRGEFVPVNVDGMSLIENASRSRNSGLELGATARATPWLDLGASYTFLDMRLRDYTTFVLDSAGTSLEVDYSGRRVPGVPRHRIAADAQVRATDALRAGALVEVQGTVPVETGNADRGTWYFQTEPGAPVEAVPFRAVPATALVHLHASYRVGRASLFGRVENLFGERYPGSVRVNENFGRFYEPGSPAVVSLGLGLATGGAGAG